MTASPSDLPPWVHSAAQMPVAFAQVREDPVIDRWVVEQCARDHAALEVVQIASGGCTAAVLATLPPVARLHLVDPNPAQIALARLKLRLLTHADPPARAAILGHAVMDAGERAAVLGRMFAALGLTPDCVGPLATVAQLGPDHAGRYELVFAALRRQLAPVASAVESLLKLEDPREQARRVAPETELGQALDDAFAEAMALEKLVKLFGAGATGNAIQPFHRHFAERLRQVLATLPAATNPWLWQLLRGGHPPAHPLPWLAQPRHERLAECTFTNATMDAALAGVTGTFHLVHLSNILDWLSMADATHTLDLAYRALRPGGWVVIRQLNSSLDIPALGADFAWSPSAEILHQQDRSFFYRTLHLGRKP